MMIENRKIYGGSCTPPAEAHKTRWHPRWPPKRMSQYLGNYTRGRTNILMSMIWFSGKRNSKNISSISPEDHVTVSSRGQLTKLVKYSQSAISREQ